MSKTYNSVSLMPLTPLEKFFLWTMLGQRVFHELVESKNEEFVRIFPNPLSLEVKVRSTILGVAYVGMLTHDMSVGDRLYGCSSPRTERLRTLQSGLSKAYSGYHQWITRGNNPLDFFLQVFTLSSHDLLEVVGEYQTNHVFDTANNMMSRRIGAHLLHGLESIGYQMPNSLNSGPYYSDLCNVTKTVIGATLLGTAFIGKVGVGEARQFIDKNYRVNHTLDLGITEEQSGWLNRQYHQNCVFGEYGSFRGQRDPNFLQDFAKRLASGEAVIFQD